MGDARPERRVARHRTALRRHQFSRPVAIALREGLLSPERSFFDYGCGHGDDIRRLSEDGFRASGWDPVHRPNASLERADVVNCGYVINVIEDPAERQEVVRRAWSLTGSVMVIAARTTIEDVAVRGEQWRDGCYTSRQTFQKVFTQSELRAWIDSTLGVESIAAAPGVFVLFRDVGQGHDFVARRTRRRRAAPGVRLSDQLFETHREALQPLVQFVSDRGRLPRDFEVAKFQSVVDAFGSVRRGFAVVRRVTGPDGWNQRRGEAQEDLLIHLALTKLRGTSRFSDLPPAMQCDVRDFFGSFKAGQGAAERALFELSDQEEINRACRRSKVGKLTPNGLYVHVSGLGELEASLRLYEACARSLVGEIEDANIVKLHRWKPKLSYLSYPTFDTVAHPELHVATIVSLRKLAVSFFDFSSRSNPPILHRKEDFLLSDDPRRPRFERLTRQEERAGLFDQPESIGTKDGWEKALDTYGVRVRGHRLIRT